MEERVWRRKEGGARKKERGLHIYSEGNRGATPQQNRQSTELAAALCRRAINISSLCLFRLYKCITIEKRGCVCACDFHSAPVAIHPDKILPTVFVSI